MHAQLLARDNHASGSGGEQGENSLVKCYLFVAHCNGGSDLTGNSSETVHRKSSTSTVMVPRNQFDTKRLAVMRHDMANIDSISRC